MNAKSPQGGFARQDAAREARERRQAQRRATRNARSGKWGYGTPKKRRTS